ncbi:sensor histidine kinase [Novosphingobium huizhouense]|uniref:sensor histidine kinase n=1 Tax=Novosphingobium huizhouense TaxID=2866625 RepID=UPI001CD8B4DD|nr:ATP-binding protein [Novosphingobium huizhouense]
MIDNLPVQIAIAGADWRILKLNQAWTERATTEDESPLLAKGQNFRSYWQWMQASGTTEARHVVERLDRFSAGAGCPVQLTVRNGEKGKFWHLSLSRIDLHGVRYTIISRSDVSELFQLRHEKRSLNISLMQARSNLARVHDEERLRLARDLHDTAAQHLIGMNLMLAQLKSAPAENLCAEVIDDLSGMLAQFHKELRGLTYLLHPPQLEQHGLHGAVLLLCEGFARRSGLEVDARVYGCDLHRTSAAESAIYRVLQETLSNVYRHAAATRVRVRLSDRPDALELVVCDDGKGLRNGVTCAPARNEMTFGVGIAGMTARVAELGGVLRIDTRKGGHGTIIVAHLPRDGGHRDLDPAALGAEGADISSAISSAFA